MKLTLIKLLFLLFFIHPTVSHAQVSELAHVPVSEPWKGTTQSPPIEVGVLTGLSSYATNENWSLLGTGAYLIVPKGWVPEIDNRVWVEGELGPTFFANTGSTHTGLQWSAHLRWDFTYNEEWTYYALGGLGGYELPSALGGSFTLHPRFGMGVEFQTKALLMLRAEVSSEFIALGVAVNF